jgi:hypothetical protein
MTFRCTAKAQKWLKLGPKALAPVPSSVVSTEWHCTLATFDRRPFFLFTHSLSLYSFFAPATPNLTTATIGAECRRRAFDWLHAEGIRGEAMAKVLDDGPDVFCKASDRGVLGSMVDFIRLSEYTAEQGDIQSIFLLKTYEEMAQVPMSRLGGDSPRWMIKMLLEPKGAA